jgi:hypothetical protein
MKTKLTNKFHNTVMVTKVENYLDVFAMEGNYLAYLTHFAQEPASTARRKLARIHRILCGSPSCRCAGTIHEEVCHD